MLIEKSRSGVYQDTPENRRLHRVGQRYGKVVQKEEDFESFADRYEKEYRRKHSGSPVKNSEIRYEALKAWDKMHSSENSRLHHVGQKYGGVKKGETKLPSKLGGLEFNEDKPTGERWYEGEMGGQRVRILQETVGKDDWWVAEISGHNVVDANNKAMTFDNVQDALEEVKQEIKSSELPKVNLSEKDFTREVNEEAMENFPNAKVKLYRYLASPTDYYDNDGNLMRSTPAITEFYSDRSYSSIGGYQIYFDRADSIGLFKTKESAIAALNKYVNAMKVKGHSKSKWTYDKLNSRYRWNYTIPTPPEKQIEKVPLKVEKQPVKENKEKQDKPTSRVTFADVPRSREVNLKKYLTDSRRKDVDRLMQTVNGMSSSAIKQAHDAAVKKFNDNFDNMKKSERASALYVIMKYKDLLNKAKSLDDKNKVAREDIVNRMSDAKVSFGSIEQILREGAEKKNGDSGAVKGDIEVDLSGSYNDHAWKSSGRSKPKKTYQLILHTDADAGAFNRGTLTRDQIKGVTLVESNPWEGSYVKIKDMDLDDLPVRADRK